MENEKLPSAPNEEIEYENVARRILKVYENELPEAFEGIKNNLSEDDDWWDNFRYLHARLRNERSGNPTLKALLDEINVYKNASEEKYGFRTDTTFN